MAESDIRQRLSTRQRFGVFHKQLGYQWEFQHPNLIRVTIPSLPLKALDSTGEKILPWSLMKLFDSGEVSSYWPITDVKDAAEHKAVLYMVYYELEIHSSFYEDTSPKYPLFLEFRKRYVKRTSAARSAILRHPSRMEPYAREELIDVRVDPETRKPKPFPEWWKEHFGFPDFGEKPKHVIPPRSELTEVLSTEFKLGYSDVDENGHANFTTYARLCFDSFAENLYTGRLMGEAECLFENGLRKLQITFLKECLMSDTVRVELWVDPVLSDTYYFDVMKTETHCAKVTFVFHKQSINGSLNNKL